MIADDVIRARLAELGAASVFDAAESPSVAGPSVRPVWKPVTAVGPAFTVVAGSRDNLALHRAVGEAPAGSVVVAQTGGDQAVAIFGDLLSQVALSRGIVALVTDGAVRDRDRIRRLGFPVFCTGVSLAGPTKRVWGEVGSRVTIGTASIAAGDWLICDGDGVVAIQASAAVDTLERAETIRAREAEIVARALAGEPTVDQLGLRPDGQ